MASLPPDTAGNVPGSNLGPYYVRLRVYDYKRPNLFEESAGPVKGHFYLPLPDQLRDDTSIDWSQENLKSMQDAFVSGGGSGFDRVGAAVSGAIIGQGAGTAYDFVRQDIVGNIPFVGSGLSKLADNLISAEAVNAFVQQSLGAAQNPNPSVIFNGPDLREYQITWTFAPRSEKESNNTRNVIQALKRSALPVPRYQNTMAVLNYPALVQLNFYPWDKDGTGKYEHNKNKSIIRYKTSVMKSVNVNYAPSNVPSFYAKGNHPAFIQLSINFKEVEYALSNDWGGVEAGQDASSAPEEIFNLLKSNVIGPAYDFVSDAVSDLGDFNPLPPQETGS